MSVASPKVSLLERARILEQELSPKGFDHMPDSGEKESDGEKRFPSDLAKSGAIKKLPDGFTFVDPGHFHELFAADLPAEQAAFIARSRVSLIRKRLPL